MKGFIIGLIILGIVGTLGYKVYITGIKVFDKVENRRSIQGLFNNIIGG